MMNRLQAARLIAEHFPDIKVVLMSGGQSLQLREECRASGADGFVSNVDFSRAFVPMLRDRLREHDLYCAV